MLRNILVIGLMTWMTLSLARTDDFVVRDTISDAETYKLEKAVEEQEAQRSVAGSKIKKKSKIESHKYEKKSTESDSEVRYWEYSE